MIKAIVFDVGGVLLRTEDRSARVRLEEQYHLPPGGAEALVFSSEAAHLSTIGKAPQEAVWQNVAQTLSLSPAELGAFRQGFWAGDQLDRDLVAFLKSCRPHYKTALLSNAWEGSRQHFATLGLAEGDVADQVLISAELGVAKPDYKIYDMLRVRIDCAYQDILFVDDFIENIQTAYQLGIKVIHYQAGMNLINQIKSFLE